MNTLLSAIAIGAAVTGLSGGLGVAEVPKAAPSDSRVVAWGSPLEGGESMQIGAYTCPADNKYLVNHNYAPGRMVPKGVQVIAYQDAAIGATIGVGAYKTDSHGYVIGWESQAIVTSVTNWSPWRAGVDILANCTSDINRAYIGRTGH